MFPDAQFRKPDIPKIDDAQAGIAKNTKCRLVEHANQVGA
jgi:hypothetical protein